MIKLQERIENLKILIWFAEIIIKVWEYFAFKVIEHMQD